MGWRTYVGLLAVDTESSASNRVILLTNQWLQWQVIKRRLRVGGCVVFNWNAALDTPPTRDLPVESPQSNTCSFGAIFTASNTPSFGAISSTDPFDTLCLRGQSTPDASREEATDAAHTSAVCTEREANGERTKNALGLQLMKR